MSEGKPNQFARVVAVVGLIAAFLFMIVIIASSGGSDDNGGGDGDNGDTVAAGPTKAGERALEDGVWVVGEGDTLVSIAEETGIELDTLIELNPDIDPQVLTTGQRISLRAGAVGQGSDSSSDSGSSGVDAGDTPASGGGVGDEGPTGTTGTSTSDSFGN